jgi:hypothetical protein
MTQTKKVYIILSYILFILPPFIGGLVLIYADFSSSSYHITSLIINIITILVIGLLLFGLVRMKKLHKPSFLESKTILFGLIGNLMLYLYTFQQKLQLENIVTVYIVLFIIIAVHRLLLGKSLKPLELWITLPIYMIYDYTYTLLRGCGFSSHYTCTANLSYDGFLTFFMVLVLIFMALLYVYKTILYRLYDMFKIANVILISLLSIYFLFDLNWDVKILLTLAIITPFLFVIDLIIRLVTKTYRVTHFLFYVRTTSIFILTTAINGTSFLYGNLDAEIMIVMVIFTYISLGINLLLFITKKEVKDVNIVHLFRPSQTYRVVPLESGELKDNSLYNEDNYNIKVMYGQEIKGHAIARVHELYDKKQLQIIQLEGDTKAKKELLNSLELYCEKYYIPVVSMRFDVENDLIDWLLDQHYHMIHDADLKHLLVVKIL